MAAVELLKKVAERGPWAGVLQDALDWVSTGCPAWPGFRGGPLLHAATCLPLACKCAPARKLGSGMGDNAPRNVHEACTHPLWRHACARLLCFRTCGGVLITACSTASE